MTKPLKVLIIDDDKDDQLFLMEAFTELYPEFKCKAVSNGKEALSYIQSDPPPPTLIFLDLNMPILNGHDFLRDYVKRSDANKSNIIVYSTSTHPNDKTTSLDLGASEYLTKITDYRKLKTSVTQLVEKYAG